MSKQRKNRLHHDTLASSLKQHFPSHATRLTVLCAVVLAMIRARSVVLYALVTYLELPGYLVAQKSATSGLNVSCNSPSQTPVSLL